ncbi:hypothetical protein [Abyssibacter sp.]|jgi:hypothetical protein|uniref:hypothetical protein n=1 Tax=Abyssibacter sp. TaxID=2320200 RepID=UPI000C47FBC8|nr:hypothetical protein [Abyssibacter sp.]MBB88370.1 hypothetical protein [Xanthomonadales bacterium]MCK5859644.1 hypothetical protein [Abyssibacter sp.]
MRKWVWISGLAMALASLTGSADVLDFPESSSVMGEQLSRPASPTRGMSKATVRRQFGEPSRRVAAIGDPPISRWVYDDFVVVFEHQFVLHSVVPEAPAPIYHANELRTAH